MALKCTQQAKFQFSATEIRWGESGPVDITETWLASNERESQGQCGIGQDIIWICKFLLQWDDLKPFLLNSWCLNWLNDWCLVLGNSLYLVSLAVCALFLLFRFMFVRILIRKWSSWAVSCVRPLMSVRPTVRLSIARGQWHRVPSRAWCGRCKGIHASKWRRLARSLFRSQVELELRPPSLCLWYVDPDLVVLY